MTLSSPLGKEGQDEHTGLGLALVHPFCLPLSWTGFTLAGTRSHHHQCTHVHSFREVLWILTVWQIKTGLGSPASFLEAVLIVIELVSDKTIMMDNINYQLDKI